MRPDRVSSEITRFLASYLGSDFVEQQPFSMESTYAESTPSTPIFFVLFPGVDPTSWVEALGQKLGMTAASGNFNNISMGQGQEDVAKHWIAKYAKEGGWLMLQNVHLMPDWLRTLERDLELAAEAADANFRCFISAEPPSLPHASVLPESLLQACIKVANEAPADLKSNLRRAWSNFSEERIKACAKGNEFKGVLFSLCFVSLAHWVCCVLCLPSRML